MPRLARHAGELVDLSLTPAGSEPISRRIARSGKSRMSFSITGRRLGFVGDTEEDFVIRVILAAEAGVVLVGLAVEPANRS